MVAKMRRLLELIKKPDIKEDMERGIQVIGVFR